MRFMPAKAAGDVVSLRAMTPRPQDYLALDDKALLRDCDVDLYKASGPGGQHRNKTSSAVRLRHRPSGMAAHSAESRSQHENRRRAIRRLRMNIACRLRGPVEPAGSLPAVVTECFLTPRGGPAAGARRLEVGPRDRRFWQVAGIVLDVLEAHHGRLAEAARRIGITTANLAGLLSGERHLLAAAQAVRKRHGQKPLT